MCQWSQINLFVCLAYHARRRQAPQPVDSNLRTFEFCYCGIDFSQLSGMKAHTVAHALWSLIDKSQVQTTARRLSGTVFLYERDGQFIHFAKFSWRRDFAAGVEEMLEVNCSKCWASRAIIIKTRESWHIAKFEDWGKTCRYIKCSTLSRYLKARGKFL